mgnify:FL=1
MAGDARTKASKGNFGQFPLNNSGFTLGYKGYIEDTDTGHFTNAYLYANEAHNPALTNPIRGVWKAEFLNISNSSIINTAPPSTSVSNQSDKNFNRNQTLNVTPVTDVDGNNVNYIVRFEAINPPTVIIQNSTDTSFITNMTNDAVYFIRIDTTDGFETTIGTTVFNLTLDTSIPVWLESFIPNSSFYRTSQNITYTCSDTNLFEVNTTIYSRNGITQRRSIGYLNLTPSSGGSKTINLTLDTSLPDGEYNTTRWCGDTKNRELPIEYVSKSYLDGTTVFTDTRSGLQVNITDGVLFEDVFLKVGESDSTFTKTTTLTDFLNKDGYVDSYYMNSEYTVPSLSNLKLSIDSKIDYSTLTFAQKIKSNSPIMEVNDGLTTHLIIGTGKNRLSYDSTDLMTFFDSTVVSIGEITYIKHEIKTDNKLKIEEGTTITIGKEPKIETLLEKEAKIK